VEAPLIPVCKEPVPKGGAFVPNLLYWFDFRYKWASGTGIDVHFSTSDVTLTITEDNIHTTQEILQKQLLQE
jgi:hypothetical protein